MTREAKCLASSLSSFDSLCSRSYFSTVISRNPPANSAEALSRVRMKTQWLRVSAGTRDTRCECSHQREATFANRKRKRRRSALIIARVPRECSSGSWTNGVHAVQTTTPLAVGRWLCGRATFSTESHRRGRGRWVPRVVYDRSAGQYR